MRATIRVPGDPLSTGGRRSVRPDRALRLSPEVRNRRTHDPGIFRPLHACHHHPVIPLLRQDRQSHGGKDGSSLSCLKIPFVRLLYELGCIGRSGVPYIVDLMPSPCKQALAVVAHTPMPSNLRVPRDRCTWPFPAPPQIPHTPHPPPIEIPSSCNPAAKIDRPGAIARSATPPRDVACLGQKQQPQHKQYAEGRPRSQ